MKRTKKLKVYILLLLIVGIITLTVAYATLSTTLAITGSANVNVYSWI